MKQLVLLGTLLVCLYGCNQTGGSSNIRPSVTTNDVASSNLNLAVEYLRRGDYETALEKLDRAYQADPGYYATHHTYALLYQQLGNNKKAEEYFKRALSLNSKDSLTMNNYGRFLCQAGRVKEAEEIFLKAADNPLYETPEVAITNAGLCVLRDGRTDDAEEYFRRALSINPRIATALLQMVDISYNKTNYMSARGYLQRYLEVAPHNAKSLWLGIRTEKQLGDEDTVSSYALMLKNNFPDSEENKLLQQSRTR